LKAPKFLNALSGVSAFDEEEEEDVKFLDIQDIVGALLAESLWIRSRVDSTFSVSSYRSHHFSDFSFSSPPRSPTTPDFGITYLKSIN
jgi:hypothetical protein